MLFSVLANISSVVSIITIIPVLYSLYLLIKTSRSQKRELEKSLSRPGSKPMFLIIDVIPPAHSITNQVILWANDQPQFESFKSAGRLPKDMFLSIDNDKEINAELVGELVNKLREIKRDISIKGTDHVHLFLRSPVVFGTIVGAELGNSFTVTVYHNERNSVGSDFYKSWGPLQRQM